MTRNRKTRQEMLAYRLAQVEKLQAQINNTYKDESENAVLKSLKARLRKTSTVLRAQRILLDGTEVRSSIADKIVHTRTRLEGQIQAQVNAEALIVSLPFDVETLEAAIAACETGDDVEFPANLTRLPGDVEVAEMSDEEHEAAFIANQEANPED